MSAHREGVRRRATVPGVPQHSVTVVCVEGVDRLSITLPAELGTAVRQAAAAQSRSVSSWLADAAAQAMRNRRLGVVLDEWEHEHGRPSEEQIAAAGRGLGLQEDRESPSGAI